MPDLPSSIGRFLEDITTAHCARCDRSGDLIPQGSGYWCGWCGKETGLTLRKTPAVLEATLRARRVDGQIVDPEHAPLQALRIPAGWRVAYNNGLYAVDPTEHTVQWWWIFKEDMLVLVHDQRHRLLDLGWSPEMDFAEGRYRLALYEGDHHGTELLYFETRELASIVAEIERVLELVSENRL